MKWSIHSQTATLQNCAGSWLLIRVRDFVVAYIGTLADSWCRPAQPVHFCHHSEIQPKRWQMDQHHHLSHTYRRYPVAYAAEFVHICMRQLESWLVSDMMTSSNGNIFRVTGHLWGNSPVTRSFDVLFDLHRNKRLSKQSWDWWFETPSHPLWRHCNGRYSVASCGCPKHDDVLPNVINNLIAY